MASNPLAEGHHIPPGGGPGGGGPLRVTLARSDVDRTPDQVLWVLIRNRTNAIGFDRYKRFIDGVMCDGRIELTRAQKARVHGSPFPGVDAYSLLKVATEMFLAHETGIVEHDDATNRAALDIDAGLKQMKDGITSGVADPDTKLHPDEEASRLGYTPSIETLNDLRQQYYRNLKNYPQNPALLPYMDRILQGLSDVPLKGPGEALKNCYGILTSSVIGPLAIELIWNYWHEEGMLVQSANAISMRFQNRRINGDRDPLANLEIAPLRPLNNLLWGYIQDEIHRLSVVRRAYEYDHHYGLRLVGKAVPEMRTADSRSKFLASFHRLLNTCAQFYKQDDDTTVIADGFPVLNGLKEVHLLLSEGQHNQYGDLPWTARIEMLIQQWLLARPEMREFLPSRTMVAYPEPWMGSVDAMKRVQGWNDTPVMHFRDLGVFGEQILLSVRFGDWSSVIDRTQAANWARHWRPEVQGYVHAYRSATGVDLSAPVTSDAVDATLPSELLRRRLAPAASRAR